MGMRGLLITMAAGAMLHAAPALRLTNAVIGPVTMLQGQNAGPQSTEAFNAGDGALNLRVTSSVPWAVPAVGAARACSNNRPGQCLPISVSFQTSGLARGTYTGTVTVNDPNAVDAPQYVTVIVQVGGGIPDRIDLYTRPSATVETRVVTNSAISFTFPPPTGGNWLSLALDAVSTFDYRIPYRIIATPGSLAEGTYTANVTFRNPTFQPDNKVVPVNLRVTNQPIVADPGLFSTRVLTGSGRVARNLFLSNRGGGTLTLSGVTVGGGAPWLSAALIANATGVALSIDSSVAPGNYTATLDVASNAANPLTVRVSVDVVPPGPPLASIGGAVNNATFISGEPLAPGEIAAVFGEQFSTTDVRFGSSLPLPTSIEGVSVMVNGVAAPLYFTSAGQINFQVPYETQAGTAVIRVDRGGQTGNLISAPVAAAAPRILMFGEWGVALHQDNFLSVPERLVAQGVPARPAKAGDVLTIYGIGFGQTTPAVRTGEGAPGGPLALVTPQPVVHFAWTEASSRPVAPSFAGLSPGFVGLYQINVAVPANLGRNDSLPVRIQQGNVSSNVFRLAVQ